MPRFCNSNSDEKKKKKNKKTQAHETPPINYITYSKT